MVAASVPGLIAAEQAIVFGATGLVGVATSPGPAVERRDVGVVLVNAGVVHRVGPNRLYVSLARQLSQAGFTVLRFDHSGIGDSPPRADQLNFDVSSVSEVVEAMDWLAAERQCRRFVLVGLCSGTLTAFRTAIADARVSGLVLLTALLLDPSTIPQDIVAEASDRRVMRSYLVEKAASRAAWRRLLAKGIDLRKVVRVFGRMLRKPSARVIPGNTELIERLRSLLERGVSVLFVFAEPTTVLEGFRMTIDPELPRLRRSGRIDVTIVRHADHTFTELRHQREILELTTSWLSRCT
jgi:pimeloyl-ACP methyl ester carboxylesterase